MRPSVLLLLVVAAAAAGCRPKCDPKTDRAHCEANTLMSCPEPGVDQLVGANQWVSHDCAPERVCVEASGTAFCALSAQPSASCPDGGREACDSTTHVYCEEGFETARFSCLSCQAPSDGGSVDCAGGPGDTCTQDSQCAAPLVCDAGFCRGQG